MQNALVAGHLLAEFRMHQGRTAPANGKGVEMKESVRQTASLIGHPYPAQLGGMRKVAVVPLPRAESMRRP